MFTASYDLVVIGAGYWGVAATLMAERKGLRVLLVDSNEALSGSRAASGHYARSWFSKEWAPRAKIAEDAAESFGIGLRWTGAEVRTGTTVREKADWAVFDVAGFLSKRLPDRYAKAEAVGPGFVYLPDERLACKNVYLACGAWTDNILVSSGLAPKGVVPLPGAGLVYEQPWELDRVVQRAVNPFRQYTFREWGAGRVRVGETTEAGTQPPDYYLAKMKRAIHADVLGWGKPVKVIRGMRAYRKEGMFVEEAAEGVFVGSGGGKIGGLMGFWAATALMEQLR